MIKALIIDDEEWTRLSLRKQADWSALGIVIIGEAKNGAAAMEMIEEERPQIVITDIRMPVMDGIKLMEKLHHEYPEVLVIVISGHSEFEYARKALSYGAFDYILKPIESKPLMQTLQRAVDKLNEEHVRKEDYVNLHRKANISEILSKEKFLTNLVTDATLGLDEIQAAIRKNGLRLDWPRTAVLVIVAANFEVVAAAKYKQDKDLTNFVLANVVGELFRGYRQVLLFRNNSKDNELILLKGLEVEEDKLNIEEVYAECKEIIETVERTTNFEIFIGIGREFTDLRDAHRSYSQAIEAVQNAGMVHANRVTHFDEISSRNEYYIYPDDKEKALRYYLGNLYKRQANELVMQIFAEMKDNQTLHPKSIRNTALGLVLTINQVLSPYQIPLDRLLNGNADETIRNERLTVEELSVYLQKIISIVIDYLVEQKKSGPKKNVDEIVDFLNRHFSEEITLNSVAERYYLNPAYLSRIFKNETGQTFNDFVTNIRMNTAAELLNDPGLRLSAVAEMAGYVNEKYFFKKFKEHYGCTPTQYRNKQG